MRTSNLIEGIVAFTGEALHDSHLRAAMRAAEGTLVHPNELHALLCAETYMEHFGGTYRTCSVYVGEKTMPAHERVRELMDEWWTMIEGFPEWSRGQSETDVEFAAEMLHHHLLCIHPYVDGNGRTSRLVLNMLRTVVGLPWLLIKPWEGGEYIGGIRWYEEKAFKPNYPDVYPAKS